MHMFKFAFQGFDMERSWCPTAACEDLIGNSQSDHGEIIQHVERCEQTVVSTFGR